MRVYNFSAGPSMLPLEVLEKVQKNLVDYEGTGMSVMEMSHRSKPYEKINDEAESLLRQLMNVPENYSIIFVQGGASLQFEAVPLNLAHGSTCTKGDYVVTGNFSGKAYKEAKKYGEMVEVASSKDKNFTYIPKITPDMLRSDADYLHICYNNTIFGTRYSAVPETGGIPLVADLSSCILSQEIDVSKFAVIYAGAQKNIAPAGVTIVIVRNDMLGKENPYCPTMMKWATQVENKSLYNTPPAFVTYVASEVFKHLISLGGVKAMQKINEEKAKLLYDFIDNSDFYKNPVEREFRSLMNVPFTTPTPELDAAFVAEAGKNGLVSIKGHRLVGGMRASIYNAMPIEGVKALIDFMGKFERNNK